MDHHVFLSYASEDRPVARRLARSLEERGWRVWWDRNIPAGLQYDEVIEAALHHARCVIVLWSARAVASRWVRAEASAAAARNILVPVRLSEVTLPLEFRLLQTIILDEHDVASVDAALGDLDAAIARLASRDDSSVAAVAPSPASPRRLPAAVVVAIALLPVVAGLAWWWDAFYREQAAYYANVTLRHGFPAGVGRLTSAEAAARTISIALVRHGRRNPPDEIRLVNAADRTPPLDHYVPPLSMLDFNPLPTLSEDPYRPIADLQVTRVLFTRDADGRILEQTGLTRAGRRIFTLHFAAPDVGQYTRNRFVGAVRESGIAYVRIIRSADGLDEKVLFLDARRQPQADEDGAFGHRSVRNADGLPVERTYLDADGADKATALGIMKELRDYDNRGNVTFSRTVDAAGQPAATSVGASSARYAYDRAGNLARVVFYDTEGRAITVPALGAAGFTMTYDQQGHLTSQTFIGPDLQPTANRFGFARRTLLWPATTRSVSQFFGPSGTRVLAPVGAAEVVEDWNDNGLRTGSAFHDEHGRPTRVENGCSRVRFGYDAAGNETEFHCLDETGAPTTTTDGFSTAISTYDNDGRRLRFTASGIDGRPGFLNDTFAVIRSSYTDAGRTARDDYLAADGSTLVNRRSGYASSIYEYDARGNHVRSTLWDATGRRTTHVQGHSAIRSTFDARGREIKRELLDTHDRPAVSDDGWSSTQYEYNAQGAIIAWQYFDRRGNPARSSEGFSTVRLTRNARGHVIETRYFDERGRPLAAARFGAAVQRFTLDADGRVIERTSHDTLGRLLANAYGYATIRYDYDQHGRETGRSILDISGRPLPHVVAIDRVAPGSFAADVGLRAGDVVDSYDGEKVPTSYHFTAVFERYQGDRRRELRVRRADRILTITVPAGRLEGLELAERVDPTVSR